MTKKYTEIKQIIASFNIDKNEAVISKKCPYTRKFISNNVCIFTKNKVYFKFGNRKWAVAEKEGKGYSLPDVLEKRSNGKYKLSK